MEGCRAVYVLIDLDAICDWFWTLSMASVLSVFEGWSETKPSLLFTCHVGMVG